MDTDELIAKMRARVEKCRWLARSMTDQRAIEVLNQMAAEGEADIERILEDARDK